MRLVLNTKQTEFAADDREYLENLTGKLAKQSPWDKDDYPILMVAVSKHKTRSSKITGIRRISESSVYYDGSLDLILPKKRLVAHFQGKTVKAALKNGFAKLLRELDKYKGMHFRNDSEYYARNTVKRAI